MDAVRSTAPRWRHGPPRRGTIIAQVLVSSTAMIGFAALAIDSGMLFSVRSDLQNAADAAALAGVTGYFTNAAIIQDNAGIQSAVRDRTQSYSYKNESFRAGGTILSLSDMTLGWFDFANRHAPLDSSGANRFNAIQVVARRAPDGTNGGVLFYFARIFGMNEGGVTATAVAAMDDRFAGFEYEYGVSPDILPFTIHIDAYNEMLASGDDDYAYTDSVSGVGDGVPEVKLFPYKLSGNGNNGNAGAGNFGILEFGGTGASVVGENIIEGVTPEALEAAMGTTTPMYVNNEGNAQSYWLYGETGMTTSLESAVEQRIGDVIAHFVHQSVVGTGSGSSYQNVGIRVGRIMHIDLHGSPNNKAFIIQPVAYFGNNVKVSASAPSTGGLVGRISLVR